MNAAGELSGLIKVETRGEQGCVEQEPDQILDSLVGLVSGGLLLEFGHDGMLWVDFHGLLGDHVRGHGVVTESLCLHDTLHVGRPAILGSGEHARRISHASRDDDLLDLVAEHFLHELGQRLELCLQLLHLLLLVLILNVEAFLGGGFQLLAVKFLQLLHAILINRVNHVQHLQTLLAQGLEEGGRRHCSNALASDVVNVGLALLHAINVLLEADQLVTGLGSLVAEELGNLDAVGGILMDTELEALAELLVELLVIILLLGNLGKHFEALLDKVLLDDTENLVLLQGLTGDVQRKILRINNTLHEVEPLWHQLLAVVHDEHTTHVELDVVALLLGLEEIERSTTRHEEESTELKLTLNAEVLHRQVILPVVGKGLVERCILLVGHILGLAHPQWLVLVELLPLVGHLLDLLGLLLLGFLLLLLINLLDLRLIGLLAFLLLLLFLFLGIGHFLLLGLLHVQLNGEANELGMLLHQILKTTLLKELRLVLLQVADDLGATLDLTVDHLRILLHCEGTTGSRFPDVLLIVVVLADNSHLVGHKVSRVETDTELTNHRNVTAGGHGLHESLGARLGNGSKIVDELILCHANTRILNGQCGIGLVRNDLDVEVWLRLDLLRLGDRLVSNLVKGIRSVGDQLTEEDFLVGVEGVNDQAHQLLNISIESKGLGTLRHGASIKIKSHWILAT